MNPRILYIGSCLLALLPMGCSDPSDEPIDTRAANLLCDDDNPCTQDTGLYPRCNHTPLTGTDCTLPEYCGEIGVCYKGACTTPTGICDDQDACTNDSCVNRGGNWRCNHTTVSCDDSNPCTIDSCDSAKGCGYLADVGASCDDSLYCTVNDACNAQGSCEGTARDCSDGNECTSDTCSEAQSSCVYEDLTGDSCSDADPCTVNDACQAGVCVGTTKDCSDGSVCTIDSCNGTTGDCEYAPNTGASCDDGDACSVSDTCQSDSTCAGTPVVCDSSNTCLSGSCNGTTGQCEYTALTGQSCSDSDVCTENDTCSSAGVCTGNAVDPADTDPCTIDACDSITGISHTPADPGTPCSTGTTTEPEYCNAVAECVTFPQSESVVADLGGQDPTVVERQLGQGRHPVAGSEDGLAAVFYEILETGTARVGAGVFSPAGEGLGLWYAETSILQPDPVVAVLPGGGFVVAYVDLQVDGDGLDVMLARLDESGNQLSSSQIANQTLDYGQHSPDVVWQDGALWVAWEDDSQVPSLGGPRLCMRTFTEALVATSAESCHGEYDQVAGSMAWAVADGSPARAWRKETAGTGSIEVRWGMNAWSLAFDQLPPSGEVPSLVALDASHLLVAYTDGLGDQMIAVLESGGTVSGPTALNTSPEARFEPSLAKTDDGIFLAWREWTSDDDVRFEKLTWDGSVLTEADGPWSLPHEATYEVGDQTRPALASVAVTVSGALWSAWNDLSVGQVGPEHGDVRVSLMATPIDRSEPVE